MSKIGIILQEINLKEITRMKVNKNVKKNY
jgi:hypothetical protein